MLTSSIIHSILDFVANKTRPGTGTHMKILLNAAVAVLTLSCASLVSAENLVDIYQQALRNDPALREAEANMLARMERKPQARAGLLPQLDASAQWNRTEGEGQSVFSSFGGIGDSTGLLASESDIDSTSWSVNLRQALFNTDQWRRVKQSDKEIAQAQVDFEAARQDLIVRVSEAYFNVLAAQDTLASERATKEAISRQLEQAERRFEVGLIAVTDVKESQAAFDDAVALEIAARRALASAREALREITGEYPATLATPGEEFPLVPPEPQVEQDWVDMALQQNFNLESAKIGTDITRDNVSIARAGHLPTLDLVASYGNNQSDGTRTTFDAPTFAEPPAPATADRINPVDSDTDQLSYGVQFTVPLFSGGRVSSVVQENVYLHRASRENYEKVARETERGARDAYLGVIAEIARVRALARSVESNQTALEATEAGYDVGTRTTVDVLNARQALSRAETQYARSKYDYLINVIRLKQSAGMLAADDVRQLNEWLVASGELDVIPGRGGMPDEQLDESSVPSRPVPDRE